PQLIRHGKVIRPGLGIQVATDQLARQLGVKEGALIVRVLPGSPAADAGLRPTVRDEEGQINLGDVIVGVDDHEVKKVDDLFTRLDAHKVGDAVKLRIDRGGQRTEVEVTLGPAE